MTSRDVRTSCLREAPLHDQTITATEFKAKCLDILDRVRAHDYDRVVITKRGKPVAMLVPPDAPAQAVQRLHGFLKGSVIVPAGVDLTAPVLDEPLAAEQGDLHR